MATKTVYTSTVTVPVYASWKCEECGEVNFAVGSIVCKRQDSSGSWRSSKQREAKENAANQAKAEWVGEAYGIISDPNNHAQDMRNGLFLQNTRCTKCRKKPKWDRDMKYLAWGGLCLTPAIISGIVAIACTTSLVAWLIFGALLAIVVTAFISEPRYKKMMKNLPKEYTPVIGSLNPELISFASVFRNTIPNPDECIAAVRGYSQNDNASDHKVQPAAETAGNDTSVDNTGVQINFCRKCGTQLQEDSDFCHKCGTKNIQQ